MRDEIKKLNRLVDEISSLLMRRGSKEIDIKIKISEDISKISIVDYNTTYSNNEVEELKSILNIQRQSEVEGFYWELMGEDSKGDELFLVGSMIDKADIEKIGGNLYITIYRKYLGKLKR